MNRILTLTVLTLIGISLLSAGCQVTQGIQGKTTFTDTIRIGTMKDPLSVDISFVKGPTHNHPTFAIWIEDLSGNYLQTLYVTRSLATGFYYRGSLGAEMWDNQPGPQQRPATLPYWLHKRSESLKVPLLPDSNNPLLDGYTGATPVGDFIMQAGLPVNIPSSFRIMLEINQPWDWNDYWTNNLYDDPDYHTSCQPSLIYAVTVDTTQPTIEYFLNPIGHGHYSGVNGQLYTDLSTLTTAKEIIGKASVKLIKSGR